MIKLIVHDRKEYLVYRSQRHLAHAKLIPQEGRGHLTKCSSTKKKQCSDNLYHNYHLLIKSISLLRGSGCSNRRMEDFEDLLFCRLVIHTIGILEQEESQSLTKDQRL